MRGPNSSQVAQGGGLVQLGTNGPVYRTVQAASTASWTPNPYYRYFAYVGDSSNHGVPFAIVQRVDPIWAPPFVFPGPNNDLPVPMALCGGFKGSPDDDDLIAAHDRLVVPTLHLARRTPLQLYIHRYFLDQDFFTTAPF